MPGVQRRRSIIAFKVVPDAADLQLRVELTQNRTNILRQLPDKVLAHRPALDGDFREDFNDQFHENSARRDGQKTGARIIAEIAQALIKNMQALHMRTI